MRQMFVSQSETTSRANRAFLLVELLIGMVIVALVMFGAAAIMEAAAQGWNDQDVTRSTQLQANQTYVRVQHALQGAAGQGGGQDVLEDVDQAQPLDRDAQFEVEGRRHQRAGGG